MTNTTPTNGDKKMEIATTILEQLGGHKFIAMTGAKDFMATENGLQMSLPRGCKNKANRLTITLNSMDLYDVEFGYYRNLNYTTRSNHEGIYYDMLQSLFTDETGLYTSL